MVSGKRELRAQMRALRKRLSEIDPEAGEHVAQHVDILPDASLIALYSAMGSELDTRPLARALRSVGASLCLPFVIERDAPMIFRRWSPGDPLEIDAGGCPAPLPLAEPVTPDLILTPLLAFDDFGGRLGQGGGYYDRTLATLPEVTRIGLAYQGQRVERLELQPYDIRLHGVLTEVGYTAARKV